MALINGIDVYKDRDFNTINFADFKNDGTCRKPCDCFRVSCREIDRGDLTNAKKGRPVSCDRFWT